MTRIATSPTEVAALAQELERQHKTKRDFIVPAAHFGLTIPEGTREPVALVPVVEGFGASLPMPLSTTAHAQLAEKCKIPAAYYNRMRSTLPNLLVENVNAWTGSGELKADRFLARTLDGQVRAILSDRYRDLSSFDLFYTAFKIARAAGAEVSSATLTDDRFELRFIHPDWREELTYPIAGESAEGWETRKHTIGTRPDSVIIPGAYISNSETGRGGLSVKPFLLDTVCTNGLIGETEFTRVHLGAQNTAAGEMFSDATRELSDKALWSQVGDVIGAVFDRERFRTLVAGLTGTMTEVLPKPIEAVDAVVKNYGLTDEDRQSILNELIAPSFDRDPGRTVFGLIQAVTHQAKRSQDPAKRSEFETIGGELLAAQMVMVAARSRKGAAIA